MPVADEYSYVTAPNSPSFSVPNERQDPPFKATSQTEGTGRNLRPLTAIQEARKVELQELLEEAKEKAQGLKAQKRKVERDIAEVKGEISELVRELVSLRRE
ncbi:hypothetical protein FQN52_004472 [Onygenales sp. PD_12]|nr:hypothetical protein FQN52_004472 [Onygenales sp. PD_12]